LGQDILPEAQLQGMLSRIAQATVRYFARWPQYFVQAPQYAQEILIWFICRYLDDSFVGLAGQLPPDEQVPRQGQAFLAQVSSAQVGLGFLDDSPVNQKLVELTKALSQMGVTDICVLVGPDQLGSSDAFEAALLNFLSTLRLFENSQVVYKLIQPSKYRRLLSQAGAVARSRLARYQLHWLPHHLSQVLERRLDLASGGQIKSLADASDYKALPKWLERCGGNTPRGWLAQARPLAAHYLSRYQKVSAAEWWQIHQQSPPDFFLDDQQHSVTIGRRCVKNIPEVEWSILLYLYQNRERVCTREEIYHQAHLPVSRSGQIGERFYPREYEGALNNALLRLRKMVEPDPKRPLFVVTYKGQGVKLDNVW
jgi:DNA-binding winged helix-turn-helix (wHTH) protein